MKSKPPFRTLPAVMSKNEILREANLSKPLLELYLQRWCAAGILRKAGPRAGIYYNLVADPDWQSHIPEAVVKRMPSAILAGPTVLHAHGCQTQIPSKMWFAVLKQRTMPQMDEVQWMPRPSKWFAGFRPEQHLYGQRSLSPKQALEDGLLYQNQGLWTPDMDDIDMDEVEEASRPISPKKKKGF